MVSAVQVVQEAGEAQRDQAHVVEAEEVDNVTVNLANDLELPLPIQRAQKARRRIVRIEKLHLEARSVMDPGDLAAEVAEEDMDTTAEVDGDIMDAGAHLHHSAV